MRNELKRKIAITAISCLAVACVSVGGVSLASAAEPDDPVWSMENGGAFYMVEGAAVKITESKVDGIDGNAMRFLFEMSEDQYAKMIENGEYKAGVSVTSYVIAEDKIDAGKTTAEEIMSDPDVTPTDIPVEKWKEGPSEVKDSEANVWHACAYVYNLPKEYYDDNVVSFAVAKTSEGTTLYTSVQSRSMSYVADQALDSGLHEKDREILETYLTEKFVWIKNANSEKIVTDFEDANSAYQKLMNDKTYTYFANSTYPTTYATSGDNAAKIVTETVGEMKGTYATLVMGRDNKFAPIWLQPTMTTTEMQKYYELGYTLKLKVYISADAKVRGLHYVRSASAAPIKSWATEDTYEGTNDEYSVTKNTWTEITIDFADYIYDCQVNNTDNGPISTQIKYDEEQRRGTIWIQCAYGASIYMSEMYLEAPTETRVTANGMTVDFSSDVPTEGVYEYYKVENGVYTELKETSIVAGKNDFKIAIVKVVNEARMVAKFVEVAVETSDEWLETLNESISGTKVTDFTSTEYSKNSLSTATATDFQNAHSKNFAPANISFVAEAYGKTGNIAKFASPKTQMSTAFRLYNTMSVEKLKEFADLGYKMYVDVYVEPTKYTKVTVRTVQYDESTESFKYLSGTTSATEYKADYPTGQWNKIEIHINDYIKLVENYPQSRIQLVSGKSGGAAFNGAMMSIYNIDTVYLSEMYLEAPKGDTTETATQGDMLTLADYKPVEEAFYEYYKFENGVYTAIEESTVSVGANDFQIAVVKVAIVDDKVERTFVKRVDVTVDTEATA